MNKKEYVQKLVQQKEYAKKCWEKSDNSLSECHYTGKEIAYCWAIESAKKLEDSKKVVVPSYALNWLNDRINQSIRLKEYALYALIADLVTYNKEDFSEKYNDELREWVNSSDTLALFILADALRYGYETEREQLYYIELIAGKYLAKNLKKGNFVAKKNITDMAGFQYKFTATEIKTIDERYWKFAVKIEE